MATQFNRAPQIDTGDGLPITRQRGWRSAVRSWSSQPLVAIFLDLVYKGASSLNWDFFTKLPVPPGESGGGMANAIVGSIVVLSLASLMGIPVGIAAGSISPSLAAVPSCRPWSVLRRTS